MFVRPRGTLCKPPQICYRNQLLETVRELKYLAEYVDEEFVVAVAGGTC